MPFHGIPFPGTYLVDEDGIITAKAFYRHLAQRESPEGLIDAALGEILLRGNEPSTANEADETGISFSMSYLGGGGVSRVGQIRHLVIRAELPGVGELRVWSDPDAAMSFFTTMGEHLQANREVIEEHTGDLDRGPTAGRPARTQPPSGVPPQSLPSRTPSPRRTFPGDRRP